MNEEWQLIEGYLDGELTADEEHRLSEWLTTDREHLRRFVRETQMHRQIREAMLARQFQADALSAVERAERRPSPSPVRALTNWLAQLFAFRWTTARCGAWVALAACLALVACLGVWCFGPTVGEPVLAEVLGIGLSLERAGQKLPTLAGTRLQSGDVLHAPENVTATISFAPENTRIRIEPGTELKLTRLSHGKRFALGVGKLEASVARQRPFRPLVVTTAQAEARVVGTKFTLTATTNATQLEVIEGKVELTRMSDGAAVKVDAGYCATANEAAELLASPFTGRILREHWTGISGDVVGDLTTHTNYPDKPSGRDFLNSFEEPTNWTGNYGARIRGYLFPPKTGQYRFWIAAYNSAELYLSTDDSPDNKEMIASLYFASEPREWTKYPWQQSSPIKLKAGHSYYIEALHKNHVGAGHLAVAWQAPGGKQEIIPGAYLAPFKIER